MSKLVGSSEDDNNTKMELSCHCECRHMFQEFSALLLIMHLFFRGGAFGCQGFQKYENWGGEGDYISSILIRLMTLQRVMGES